MVLIAWHLPDLKVTARAQRSARHFASTLLLSFISGFIDSFSVSIREFPSKIIPASENCRRYRLSLPAKSD